MGKKERKITHFFNGIGISLSHLEPVTRRKSAFGKIEIFQHPELGKIFVLNGEVQHVEAWAPLYHEPLVHLSAAFLSTVKDVLILGGGTLFAAAEVLKYQSVQRVLLLERDPSVPEITARYYQHAKTCKSDRRLNITTGDAYSCLADFQNQFDLIINDGADLISSQPQRGPHRLQRDCFAMMLRALKPGGVCADVVFRHVFEQKRTVHTIKRLQQRGRLAMSLVFLPEYHGVLHLLTIWGKSGSKIDQALSQPINREQRIWLRDPANSPCGYYDPRFLRYYLYLPKYLKTVLKIKKRSA